MISEKFARFMGTPQFLIGMTVFVRRLDRSGTSMAPESLRFDPYAVHLPHPDPQPAGVVRRPADPARAEPAGRPRPGRPRAGPQPRRAQPRRHRVPHPRGGRPAHRAVRRGDPRLRALRAARPARRAGGARAGARAARATLEADGRAGRPRASAAGPRAPARRPRWAPCPRSARDAAPRRARRRSSTPRSASPITELGMVESVAADEARPRRRSPILLTVAGCPLKDTLTRDTTAALAAVDGRHRRRPSTLGVMSDEQRGELRTHAARRGRRARDPVRAGPARSPGSTPSRPARAASASRRSPPTSRSRWPQQGLRVGVVDADIYGFSIPRMLGVTGRPTQVDDMILPPLSARREGHLDRHVRARQPAGRLARADAAPRAAAVPRRRVLGRPRRAPARPAAGHRRHRHLGRPADARAPRSSSSPPRSSPPPRSPSGPARSRCRPTSGSSASSRTCPGSSCPTAPAWSSSAPAAGSAVADSLTRAIGADVPLLGQIPLDTRLRESAPTRGCRSCSASPTPPPPSRCAGSPRGWARAPAASPAARSA